MAGSPAGLMGLHADPERVGQADAHATVLSLLGPDPAGIPDMKIKNTNLIRQGVGKSQLRDNSGPGWAKHQRSDC